MDKMRKFKYKWFYTIDHKGLLYLEEIEPKNYTSCLKQIKALNFFFTHLQENDLGIEKEYGYISPCWTEMNFVKPYKYPIVFNNFSKREDGTYEMRYAGDLKQVFDPSKLIMDEGGHFLHPLDNHKYLKYGSFESNISVSFCETVTEEEGEMYIEWEGQKHKLYEEATPDIIKRRNDAIV
ncbi:unnamed protein product [Moneuplotes crassus]|uniref:Uncharacterized protein n=1 Tax=Euplotes crassus TaxID=5936 RepID=A0AAD1XUU4_EUPCR|nr:unnamed protein product [Moneuplotes crassus]